MLVGDCQGLGSEWCVVAQGFRRGLVCLVVKLRGD